MFLRCRGRRGQSRHAARSRVLAPTSSAPTSSRSAATTSDRACCRCHRRRRLVLGGYRRVTRQVGSGVLTLSGRTTYTGATTVNAGTLIAASSGALPSDLAARRAHRNRRHGQHGRDAHHCRGPYKLTSVRSRWRRRVQIVTAPGPPKVPLPTVISPLTFHADPAPVTVATVCPQAIDLGRALTVGHAAAGNRSVPRDQRQSAAGGRRDLHGDGEPCRRGHCKHYW